MSRRPYIARVFGTVKVVPMFTCFHCGKREKGDSKSVDVDFMTPEGMADYLESLYIHSNYMPVGWSYNGEFTCGCVR